jgi:hypothetical protein
MTSSTYLEVPLENSSTTFTLPWTLIGMKLKDGILERSRYLTASFFHTVYEQKETKTLKERKQDLKTV